MVEKMTDKEAKVQETIRALRKAKELLTVRQHLNLVGEEIDYDSEGETVKVKKPKAEDGEVEIKNNEGTHSGYGLAGEVNE